MILKHYVLHGYMYYLQASCIFTCSHLHIYADLLERAQNIFLGESAGEGACSYAHYQVMCISIPERYRLGFHALSNTPHISITHIQNLLTKHISSNRQ